MENNFELLYEKSNRRCRLFEMQLRDVKYQLENMTKQVFELRQQQERNKKDFDIEINKLVSKLEQKNT